MMRAEMAQELSFFAAMLCYGVVTAFCYHVLLFFRTVLRHKTAVTDAEDILFLAAAGFGFFLTAYVKNDGILRWYAYAGAGIGILAYVRTAGAALERVRKWLLQKIGKPVRIKAKFSSKGQVPADEGSAKRRKKEKKKKRS